MKVSIGIVTHNRPDLLRRTLASLEASGHDYTLDLVDNGSTEPQSIEIVRSLGGIRNQTDCHLPALGFNLAIEAALSHDPDLVVCGPDDVEFHPGWLATLVGLWTDVHPAVGIISYYKDRMWRQNRPYGFIEIGPKHQKVKALLQIVVAAFWSFRPSTWQRIGPVDVKRHLWEKEACYRLRDAGLLACSVDLSTHLGWNRSTLGNNDNFASGESMDAIWRQWGLQP